jgi:hypothetical protein
MYSILDFTLYIKKIDEITAMRLRRQRLPSARRCRPVDKVVDKKRIIGKRGLRRRRKRHSGSLRPILNFTPRDKLSPPGAKLSPRGEFCPLGVKLSVRPSILLNSR